MTTPAQALEDLADLIESGETPPPSITDTLETLIHTDR